MSSPNEQHQPLAAPPPLLVHPAPHPAADATGAAISSIKGTNMPERASKTGDQVASFLARMARVPGAAQGGLQAGRADAITTSSARTRTTGFTLNDEVAMHFGGAQSGRSTAPLGAATPAESESVSTPGAVLKETARVPGAAQGGLKASKNPNTGGAPVGSLKNNPLAGLFTTQALPRTTRLPPVPRAPRASSADGPSMGSTLGLGTARTSTVARPMIRPGAQPIRVAPDASWTGMGRLQAAEAKVEQLSIELQQAVALIEQMQEDGVYKDDALSHANMIIRSQRDQMNLLSGEAESALSSLAVKERELHAVRGELLCLHTEKDEMTRQIQRLNSASELVGIVGGHGGTNNNNMYEGECSPEDKDNINQ